MPLGSPAPVQDFGDDPFDDNTLGILCILTMIAMVALIGFSWNAGILMILVYLAGIVATALISLFILLMFGKVGARRAFVGLTAVWFVLMLGMRLFSQPKLGLQYDPYPQGALVGTVGPGSMAEYAGLKAPFLIESVDGQALGAQGQTLTEAIKGRRVGDHVQLTVLWPNAVRRTVDVYLGR